MHSENECEILTANKVKCTGSLDDYFSLEVLRCLLLKDKDPKIWERVMEHEHHEAARANGTDKTLKMENTTMDFILNLCNLKEVFDSDIVSKVIGILSVNTFWGHQYTNR